MKVSEQQNSILNLDPNTIKEVNVKNFTELMAGDKFKATVLDIMQNKITIRLNSGDVLTAKSLILPEARIGEETSFIVKENAKGQILLEMLKSDNVQLQNKVITESLNSASIPITKENLELVRSLMENRLPIDSDTVQKAAFFNHSSNNINLEKVLFLLKEDFPMTAKSVNVLNGILNKTLGLKENISKLIDEILNIKDKQLKKDIIKSVLNDFNKEHIEGNGKATKGLQLDDNLNSKQIGKLLTKKLFVPIKDRDTIEKLENSYERISQAVKEIKGKLPSEQQSYEKLTDSLNNIRDTLQFMNHVNNYKNYFQLPFQIENNKNEAEIFIMKNKKKKTSDQSSVLIGLDLVSLGRVETFINKTNTNLTFQFKASDDDSLKFISDSLIKLKQPLLEKGYSISQVTFKKLIEPFDVTKEFEEKTNEVPKRYSFDMRV